MRFSFALNAVVASSRRFHKHSKTAKTFKLTSTQLPAELVVWARDNACRLPVSAPDFCRCGRFWPTRSNPPEKVCAVGSTLRPGGAHRSPGTTQSLLNQSQLPHYASAEERTDHLAAVCQIGTPMHVTRCRACGPGGHQTSRPQLPSVALTRDFWMHTHAEGRLNAGLHP